MSSVHHGPSYPNKPRILIPALLAATFAAGAADLAVKAAHSSNRPNTAAPLVAKEKPKIRSLARQVNHGAHLANSLPRVVQADQDSVVKVMYGKDGRAGSGVKVGPNLILSAGHVVLSNDKPVLACGEDAVAYSVHSRPNHGDRIVAWSSDYAGPNRGNLISTDTALLRVAGGEAFDSLPTVPIAPEEPKNGAPVTFINYQNGPDNMFSLFPNEATAQAYNSMNDDHPAEYEGIIVGHIGSKLEVATGIKGYGYGQLAKFAINSYFGGSGGAVINQDGQLVATLADIVQYKEPQTARMIFDRDRVRLPVSASTDVQLSAVQPISQSMIQRYEAMPTHRPAC